MRHFLVFQFFFLAVFAPAMMAQTLDVTFSNGGKFSWGNGDDSESAYDIALDNQGRILVAGITSYDPGEANSYRGFVLRLTSTGQLDPAFGSGGVSYIDFPSSSDKVYALALDNLGEIYLAGTTNSLQGCVFKLSGTNGALVTSWGSGGRAILPQAAEFHDLLVEPDQKVVAAGWGVVNSDDEADYIVARFKTNGQLDPIFHSGLGWINVQFDDEDFAYSIAREPSTGSYVVSGVSWTCASSSCNDLSIARINALGQLDAGYGKIIYSTSGPISFGNMTVQMVNNEPRALVSGSYSSALKGFLARWRESGSQDNAFGFLTFAQIGLWAKHTQQGDNKILFTGSSANGLDLLRTSVSGIADPAFGTAGMYSVSFNNAYLQAEEIIAVGNSIFIAGNNSIQAGDVFVTKINTTDVVTTASPDASLIGMAVYPNPSAGDIDVRFTPKETGAAQLRIFNLTGQLVYEMPIELLAGEENITSLVLAGQLNPGSYLVQLQTPRMLASRKMVIEQ